MKEGMTAENIDVNEEQSQPARPFIKWAGGKNHLLPELIKKVPKTFNRYFEPMIGGGALYFKLSQSGAYISDINPDLINTYRVVKSNVEELIQDLSQHVYEEDYFYKIRNIDREEDFIWWTDIQKASRLIYLNKTCYNGLYRVNSKGHFNTPFGSYKNPKIVDEDNLRACSKLLQNTELVLGSFEMVREETKAGDFVYFDPPYVPLNKTSNFTAYSKGGFAQDMQIALRDICVELNAMEVKFMLSNSFSPFVKELYQDFNISILTAVRSINSKATRRGKIKEIVVTNY